MDKQVRSQSAAQILVVGALILGALVFGLVVHSRDRGHLNATARAALPAPAVTDREPPADSRIELLQAQIAGLNDRLNESERLAKAARDAQGPPEPAASAEPAAPKRPSTDGAAVNRHYDQRFEAQAVDAAWATSETRSLRAFIDTSAPGAKIEALECRSSMCRARLGFSDRKERQAFLSAVTSPDFASAAYVNTDAESGKVTMFTARAGQDLPDVSRE